MSLERFEKLLDQEVKAIREAGTAKGDETVIAGVLKAEGERGPRYLLEGQGEKPFIRMNANSYLGLALEPEIIEAEEQAARSFGVGPGAVRFISGSFTPHLALEARLAAFHGREAAMITSSAYTSTLGVVSTLTTPETMIISDELNHNCIINAMKLARPKGKKIYPHNDVAALAAALEESVGQADAAMVITDGVFSMRGDYAPLKEIRDLCTRFDEKFERGVVLVIDDSHGVGAYGATGRGTEEITGSGPVEILIATLGKALGVNGGYFVSSQSVIDFMREKNPFYIYTNPITPSEASAALAGLELLDSEAGVKRLEHLSALTERFSRGLVEAGHETIDSPHPVTPLVVRDTARTNALVKHLFEQGVLATGLAYPVVPRGDDLIRFQLCADHTEADVDAVLAAIRAFEG
ncbi:MAG: aminotransferase class I/II-fold pyridoxal phosphate-dependent enzyme [Deltaproteobacteria bacterium]|nr:aminotransferase class I/II-fold pyridoxal phosphate-dependent enzyme [Deltaproteobacteria bacterium]